jgi:hypothetical protein
VWIENNRSEIIRIACLLNPLFEKEKIREVLLGKVPPVEIMQLNLGRVREPYSTLLRTDVAKNICQKPFFKNWLGQRLVEQEEILVEITEIYLSYGKNSAFANWSLRECITPLVREIWLSDESIVV